MADPAPAVVPGARSAQRPVAVAALLLLAGFLVGLLVPAGDGDVPRTSTSVPTPAGLPTIPRPATPDLPALRAENESLRTKVAALEKAAPRSDPPPAAAVAPPALPGAAPAAMAPGTAALRVLVTDGSGSPVPGALVQTLVFRNSNPADKLKAETDARGVAEFPGLAAGPRRVGVYVKGYSAECDPRLEAGRVLEIPVVVEAGVAVEGVVRHAETGPLAGIMVALHRQEGPFNSGASTSSRRDGTFRFDSVSPGPWVVWLTGGSWGSSRPVANLVVPEGRPLARDIVVGVPRLSGTVRDGATGAPIPGVRIFLSSGGLQQTIDSDVVGAYRFLDLVPGPYGFILRKDGYGIRGLQGVEIPEEGRRLDIGMTPAAVLSLRVAAIGGGPYTGKLQVSAVPKDPETGTRGGTSIQVDETGAGTCREISPGAYTLTFRIPGGSASAVLDTEVPAGASTLDVQLAEK